MTYEGKNFYFLDLTTGPSVITGNKAWKLKYNLEAYYASGAEGILTFGGAYSNHVYQTAKLGHHLGIPTIGLIRGSIDDEENPMLTDVRQWGMTLKALDRSTYRKKGKSSQLSAYQSTYNCYIIPEGGTNVSAIEGTTELGEMINRRCDQHSITKIALAVGTGGTIAGIINGLQGEKHVLGYGALKGDFLTDEVGRWVTNKEVNWRIEADNYFGGYAKWSDELIDFIISFHQQTGVTLDPIYTGKMMYNAWIGNRLSPEWLYIHTGGIQGNRGFNQRLGTDLPTS